MGQAKLVLTAMSAADFYRTKFPAFTVPSPSAQPLDFTCVYKGEDVRALAPFWLDASFTQPEGGVVHVLTRSAAERGNSAKIRAHVWSGVFPPGSFFEYNPDVVIASPEFAFLQLATDLSFEQLVAYGDELCGYYALSAVEPTGFRVRKQPLTTLEKLSAFVQSAEGMRGCRQAQKALPHIVEGAQTPTDTVLEMLACLSYHWGGYCLPKPQLGYHAKLSKRGSLLLGEAEALVNVCWPDAGACLEVVDAPDGETAHGGSVSPVGEGGIRKAALEFSGLRVVEVTRGQVGDFDGFETRVLALADVLDKRVPGKKRGPLPQRENLRSALFSWMSRHGHAS